MKIITDPEQLRIKCKPVLQDTNMKNLNACINEASKLMLAHEGVGIAANQVGVDRQFIIAIISEIDKSVIRVFLNPTIVSHSDETNDDEEGCLSYPNQYGTVTRWNDVTLRYMNRAGRIVKEAFSGINARIIQHEVDHLLGVSCMDIAKDIHIKETSAAS